MAAKKHSVDKDVFLSRCNHFQWVLLFINMIIIAAGGCDLGLAFAVRPLMRLVRWDYKYEVSSICDLLAATGFIQITTASLDIMTTCSKRVRYLYISITACVLAIIVEVAAIASALYILSEGTAFMTSAEDLLRPWFLWNCLPFKSCENGVDYYVHSFMMPQVGVTGLAIILHGMSILYLCKLFRARKYHQHELWRAKDHYARGMFDGDEIELMSPEGGTFKDQSVSSNNNDSDSDFGGKEEPNVKSPTKIKSPNHIEVLGPVKAPRSPVSILKDPTSDFGYIGGDEVDADIDTVTHVRSRQKQKDAHSCTFNANVEVHVMSPRSSDDEGDYKST